MQYIFKIYMNMYFAMRKTERLIDTMNNKSHSIMSGKKKPRK